MNTIRKHPITTIVIIALALASGVVIHRIATTKSITALESTGTQSIALLKLEDYREQNAKVSTVGVVEALEQVELRSQLAEYIKQVHIDIGSKVTKSQALITLENNELQARLRQAEANLQAEQSRLEELRQGTREEQIAILETRVRVAEEGVINAQKNSIDAIKNDFTTADNAIRNTADVIISNPQSIEPKLVFTTSNNQTRIDLEFERRVVEEHLNEWEKIVSSLKNQEIIKEQTQRVKILINDMQSFLTKAALAVNTVNAGGNLTEATISTYKANISLARNEINRVATALLRSEETSLGAETSFELAKNELTLARAGAQQEQIKAQEARVSLAEAGRISALVQLEKTIIKSPINGTIASLPARVNELANPGEILVSIVNTSGLQVRTFINGQNSNFIQVGAKVKIENSTEGIVENIAPSIDPITRKVEVVIAITNQKDNNLVIGQFVNTEIEVDESATRERSLFLPLEAVKVTPTASFIYVLGDNNIVEEKEVQLGRVIGESIEIKGNLKGEDEVISSVRGIKPGQIVEVMSK